MFISNLYPPIYIGGYEQICLDVAQGLQEHGHTVHVLTSSFRAQEIRESEQGVSRLLRLKWKGRFSDTRRLPTILNNIQVERHNVRVMHKLIEQFQPDVSMVWNGAGLGHGILGTVERHSPVVYYLQDMWLPWVLAFQRPGRMTKFLRNRYRRTLGRLGIPPTAKQLSHLIFVSRYLQQQHVQAGMDCRKATVIYNSLSSEVFALRRQHILYRQSNEPFRILFCGQIKFEKGVTTLIEALSRLRMIPGLEHTTLSLLGAIQSQAYGQQLYERINTLDLANVITFLPVRPRVEIPAVFDDHDIFAFPSQWGEPFGLALLEAMASGIPVVAAADGGATEILRDGENAHVFPARDVNELTHKLAWMLTHPQEAAAIGRAASKEVRQRFQLDTQVQFVEDFLRTAAAESPMIPSRNRA